jgi:hypothetical protein
MPEFNERYVANKGYVERLKKALEEVPIEVVENDLGNVDDGFNWGTTDSSTYMEWLTASDPSEHPDKSYAYFKENIKPCLERIKEL